MSSNQNLRGTIPKNAILTDGKSSNTSSGGGGAQSNGPAGGNSQKTNTNAATPQKQNSAGSKPQNTATTPAGKPAVPSTSGTTPEKDKKPKSDAEVTKEIMERINAKSGKELLMQEYEILDENACHNPGAVDVLILSHLYHEHCGAGTSAACLAHEALLFQKDISGTFSNLRPSLAGKMIEHLVKNPNIPGNKLHVWEPIFKNLSKDKDDFRKAMEAVCAAELLYRGKDVQCREQVNRQIAMFGDSEGVQTKIGNPLPELIWTRESPYW